MAPQAATTALLVAGVLNGCVLEEMDGRKSLFCVSGQSHTSHTNFFFKEFAVIILVQGYTMLSL
jgi:hypothetical protein